MEIIHSISKTVLMIFWAELTGRLCKNNSKYERKLMDEMEMNNNSLIICIVKLIRL